MCMSSISFLVSVVLSRTPCNLLDRSTEGKSPCLAPGLNTKASCFSWLFVIVTTGLFFFICSLSNCILYASRLLIVFIINVYWIFPYLLITVITLFFFSFWVISITFQVLNQPCILVINFSWSLCIFIFMHYLTALANILLNMCACIFMRDNVL